MESSGENIKVVIIGGVACGPKTASRLKRLMPEAEVTLIDKSATISYGACGLPYYVESLFDDVMVLNETPVGIRRTPQFFEAVKGFKVLTRVEAISIDRSERKVRVKHLDTGKEEDLYYDKLVIATGAEPLRPPIPGIDKSRVWTVRNLEDAVFIRNAIEKEGCKKAVVVGGGYIGLEMAEALKIKGLDVSIVEMCDHVLPQMLDKEIALLVQKHLVEKGVKLFVEEKLEAIEGDDYVKAVRTNKRMIDTDMVVFSVGVKPRDELARKAGLACHEKGGIIVNHFCQTSDPNIYAGGDCVVNSYIYPYLGAPVYTPLGSIANKHGRIIANHITGLVTPFMGVLGTTICKVFDLTVGRVGITEEMARNLNLDVETAIWAGPDKPHYMGGKPIIIKMIAQKRYRKLIGVEIVGTGDVSKRLDVAATSMFFGATVDQIAYLDLGYAPPYSPPLDPIMTTAHVLLNKMNNIAKSLNPLEAYRWMKEKRDIILLDVRTPQEFSESGFKDERVIHIPLGQLRQRASELSKDKDILTFCKVSMRGYEAQRILNAQGFERVWFIEGGLVAWPFE